MRRHTAAFRSRFENARSSLWFIPAILVTAAITLSILLLWADQAFTPFIRAHLPWLFGGAASSAQEILATIAGSVITVISIAFSLTIIAIQQASAQYSPRVLRNFTADKGNQVVLGTYIATFVYALLVLREVRVAADGTDGFVPAIALGFAVVLVLVCMAMLIYFISHIATSLQASTVISRIHQDLLDQIRVLYPEQIGRDSPAEAGRADDQGTAEYTVVRSTVSGFVNRIDDGSIDAVDYHGARHLHILPKIGDFITEGQIIARVAAHGAVPDSLCEDIRSTIMISHNRSMEQDPLFAIRQLVDIALKGLSPGINDVTTSKYCIHYLGDALGMLAQRKFPGETRVIPGRDISVTLTRSGWDDFVAAAFDEVLRNIKGHTQVLDTLLAALCTIAERLPDKERARPLSTLLDDIEAVNREYMVLASDRRKIAATIGQIRTTIRSI